MSHYEKKTKEELIAIISHLTETIDRLSPPPKEYSDTLHRCLELNRKILQNLPDMITLLDYKGNVLDLVSSPETNHLESAKMSDLLHANIKTFLPEKAYEQVFRNMQQVIATQKRGTTQHELQTKGETHHYENYITPLDENHLLCVCRDISQQYKAEKLNQEQGSEIIQLNFLMDAIINNVPVYLFIKDPQHDFRYLYLNKSFATRMGIPTQEAVGKNDFELFPQKEAMTSFHESDLKALINGEVEYLDTQLTPTGESQFIHTLKKRIDSDPKHSYIIGISWDITELKKNEKRLLDALEKAEEADKLKSAFLANMSHEIRTPLNAIVGFSKVIADETDNEECKLYAQIIEKNSEILLKLFNDILDLSALKSGMLDIESQPIHLIDLCSQLHQCYTFKLNDQVKLSFDTPHGGIYAKGDWNRLMQVFGNLLNNAIKFTPIGEIHFGFKNKKECIECYVKDTGIGIPASKAATIFERFGKIDDFTQGSGLGLNLCRSLIEKMGGRIWVHSRLHEGTTFFFTLPVDKPI